jgi:TonB-dependent starch-binding outer membrane protein SusC
MKIKVNFKSLMLLACFTALSSFAFAQKTISGLVTDGDTNEPLVGAAVVVSGTTKGTLTDVDGKYTLTDIPATATTLTFSFTGYSNLTVPIGSGNVLDAKLKGGTILESVVVTGYATLKQKEVTSAIATVKAEDFNKGNVNDPTQLLQGKVAGLSIVRPGGDPNGGFDIRLRGLSTISGSTAPLIIIDGVPGANLQTLDPNDIAQMDVLKDGSAAAIYGTRGSNGVILVTTKKGIAGKTAVEYNGSVVTEQVAKTVPVLSATDFVKYGGTNLGSNTDWTKAITRNALSHIHNLSLGGGAGSTTFRFGLNYRDIQGVSLNDGFNQLNGRANVTQKALGDKLTLTADLSATSRNATYAYGEAFQQAVTYNPTATILGTDGSGLGSKYFQQNNFQYFNPVAIVEQSHNTAKIDRLLASFRGEYELAKGLKWSAQYSLTRDKTNSQEYYDRAAFYKRGGRDGTLTGLSNGVGNQYSDDNNSQLFNTLLSYAQNFGKIDFNVFGGYEIQDFKNSGFGFGAGNIFSDAFGINNFSSSTDIANGFSRGVSYRNDNRLIAMFGRAGVNIDDTYSLFGSVRREGSSRFGANNKWGIFPAVGASVNLAKLITIPGIDNLKLRAGYGVTGAIPGENFLSQLLYRPTGSFFNYNGGWVPTYAPNQNGNPDLKWEKKGEINVGLDFAALDFRLTGSLDVYNRATKDLIYNFTVPVPPNFAATTWANVGQLNSSGIEAVVNYQVLKSREKSWTTGLNFSTANVKLVSLSTGDLKFGSGGELINLGNTGSPGQNAVYQSRVKEGQNIGDIYVYNYSGYDDKGKIQFLTKDGKKVPTKDITDADRVLAGNALPKLNLGWNNSFTFGNIDFNFFVRGTFGHSLANNFRAFFENIDPSSITTKNAVQTKYFDPKLTEATNSNRFVEKADFVVLDNATIGYTLPMAQGGKISKARIFLSTNAPLMFTGYTGVSPEPRYKDTDNGNNILAPGLDRRDTYLRTRSFTLGLNVGF